MSKNERIDMAKVYKKAESYLELAPASVKKALKKEGIKNLFNEWLKFVNLTLKEMRPSDLSSLSYFMIMFPSRKKRDEYMIKMIRKFGKKGKTAVVVGSTHI